MENEQSSNRIPVWIIVAAALVLLFLFRFPPLRFLIMITLAIAGMIVGAYVLWQYMSKRRAAKAFRQTEEGMVAERIDYCEEQIERNKQELKEILQNIEELKQEVGRQEISLRNRQESERLIKAFTSEADLRRQKISFFELAVGKLRRLLHNHQLTRSIAEKRERLESLKENHYEDLASLEELKTELEMSVIYLDTIETLSLRMLESTDYDDAKRLKVELEEMTRDLDTL